MYSSIVIDNALANENALVIKEYWNRLLNNTLFIKIIKNIK